MMMNLVAIILVTTSLAVSGVFSPKPQNNNNGGEQVIVKDGHRAVVVEYADTSTDGNTKVSISPPEPTKVKEAKLAHDGPLGSGPKQLICDAYGKCKEKIGNAWSRTNEKAAEAEEDVKEVVGKGKDLASNATQKVEESTLGVRQNVKEKVREAGEAAERMKEKAGEKAREAGEMAKIVKGKTEQVVEETVEKVKQKGRNEKKKLFDIFKRGEDFIFKGSGYVFGLKTMVPLMSMIQILGFAMAYGISVWVTFIMSHVLAGVLPRQQFGLVQSKFYPVYFKAMVGSIGLALLGHLFGKRGKILKNKAEMLQAYNLMGCLVFVLANLLLLEPKATKVMFRRMKLEKEEGRGRGDRARVVDTVPSDGTTGTTTHTTTTSLAATSPPPKDECKTKMDILDERLKKLNSCSSLLNVMTLMGLTWHLVYLSQRLAGDNHGY